MSKNKPRLDDYQMIHTSWDYDCARDAGLSFVERLKECPREPDPFIYGARFAAAIAIRAALKAYNRLEITGRKNLPRDGSYVIVANHASHLDAVAILSALPLRLLNRAYPIAARDYFASNSARLALTAIIANVMLLDRNSKGMDALTNCKRMLDERDNVLVMFPEGTRSTNGRVGLFRRGIGLLLAGERYPVVPCYLDGTNRAWPKGALIPRPSRVRLFIGEPRTYERVERSDAGALHVCADLQAAVRELTGKAQQQTASRPVSQEAYL